MGQGVIRPLAGKGLRGRTESFPFSSIFYFFYLLFIIYYLLFISILYSISESELKNIFKKIYFLHDRIKT